MLDPKAGSVPLMLSCIVSIAQQTLQLERNDGSIVNIYPVSTARLGTGFQEGSYQTPTGRFCIAQKIGDGLPDSVIFRGRIPCGFWPQDALPDETDVIMSRILRLQGLDPENANTWDRYIYIHGTNHINQLGTPCSHGCIRMAPEHIVELFDLVEEGTPILIS